jgi:hypothetical protein
MMSRSSEAQMRGVVLAALMTSWALSIAVTAYQQPAERPKVINGHNPTTTTIADLGQYAEFIADFVKFVQDAKRAGKTIDDVVNTWKTPAKYAGDAEPNAARAKADAQVIWAETK